MKNFFVLLSLLMFFHGAVAQDRAQSIPIESQELPEQVLKTFTRDHPGENGTWFREGDQYRVQFVQRSSRKAQTITYDPDGNMVQRDSEQQDSKDDTKRRATDRYLQPTDTGARNTRPAPPSEVLRVEDAGLPDSPGNKAYSPQQASGGRDN